MTSIGNLKFKKENLNSKKTKAAFAVVVYFCISCQNINPNRKIASFTGPTETAAVNFYEDKVKYDFIKDQYTYQKQIEALYKKDGLMEKNIIYDADPKLLQQINLQSKVVEGSRKYLNGYDSEYPVSLKFQTDKTWRQHHEEFLLHDLGFYQLSNDGKILKTLLLSTTHSRQTILKLTNKSLGLAYKKPLTNSQMPGAPKPKPSILKATLECNDQISRLKGKKKTAIAARSKYNFDWYEERENPSSYLFELTNPATECRLYFQGPESAKKYGIQFQPDLLQMETINSPNKQFEVCYLPSNAGFSGIEKFFTEVSPQRMSCPVHVPQFRTLERSYDGIKAKLKMLTGSEVTDKYLDDGDPLAPLDFSKAPKLDAILISYLVFRADFSGTVLIQALKYHAEKGVPIRLAVSDVITLKKDRKMLYDFQAQYPSVKLIFYKYDSMNLGFRDLIDGFHRTNHAKLLLTYSQSQPENNAVIFGGRNVHDGFIFDRAPLGHIGDSSRISYGDKGDEAWARWEDFETQFNSTELVQTVMGQFFAMFNLDYSGLFSRSYTESIQMQTPLNKNYFNLEANESLMRSFVSVPYKDDRALENLYVKMLDSAEKEIRISTPYFNLTQKLLDAFVRAIQRGVKIQLITRLDLDGDTADIVLSDVNKAAVNKLYDKMSIYEYTTKGKILHSKLVLIDGKFVMLGSVNLNLRSFIHDVENTQMIYGADYYNKMVQLYELYKTESRLLTEKQKTSFLKKILINIIGTAL